MYLTWLLFSFQGRAGRLPFWLFTLASIPVTYFGAVWLAGFADLPFRTACELTVAIMLLPMLAVQAKRWHDRNKSAWWMLINFVPVVGSIWMLIECGALQGTPGTNAFGADPLGRAPEQESPLE